jgi:hypothetical protein
MAILFAPERGDFFYNALPGAFCGSPLPPLFGLP